MKIGDVVSYHGEAYKVVWVYNGTSLEIKPNNENAFTKIILVKISELD